MCNSASAAASSPSSSSSGTSSSPSSSSSSSVSTSSGCSCQNISSTVSILPPWQTIDDILDLPSRQGSPLEASYRSFINKFLDRCWSSSTQVPGALLIEPLMVGAGGLKFIDPLYQRILIQECRKRGLPIVYDEVAVGMYRLGPATASTILLETPDIAVYGKLISGGYLPIAATLTTSETFHAFLGKKKWHALLHGHSYTASPMACIGDLPTPLCLSHICMLVIITSSDSYKPI